MAVTVTSSPPPLIDLRALHLDDARALLRHGHADALPPSDDAPATYLQAILDGLCQLSTKDPLTGLANRRHLNSMLMRELDAVARTGDSTLLLLLDIDYFKSVNDTYGHRTGDLVLQAVGRCLASKVRPQDTVARYGGEEFAVVLPDCQAAYGEATAERLRATLADLAIPVAPDLDLRVTVSIGGAFAPAWVRSTVELWTERADIQLYLAKAEGRNRVCIDPQQIMSVSAEEKSLLFGSLIPGEPAWIDNSSVADAVAGGAMQKVNR